PAGRHRALAGGLAGARKRQQGRPRAGGGVSRRAPDAPPQPPAPGGEDTLLALLGALGDPGLPDDARALLQDAADALQVALLVAESERVRYRALLDAVPDPGSVIAWDGTGLDPNRAGAEAYGRPAHEIIGQDINVLNPDLPRDHMGPVRDTLA